MSQNPGQPAGTAGGPAERAGVQSAKEQQQDLLRPKASDRVPSGAEAEIGEGAPRYANGPDQIPPHGSRNSWSAAPNPGFAPDPEAGGYTVRFISGALIGALLLTLGVWYGTRILTGRSSNGNGAAPWAAVVRQDGADVGGINAENAGAPPPVVLPGGVKYGTGASDEADAVRAATATCAAATGDNKLSATTGTSSGIGDWAAHATPTLNSLKSDAASLSAALVADDQGKIALAANDLCATFTTLSVLPALPDATGSAAWSAGVEAYAAAANDALKGVGGDVGALSKAQDDIRVGNEQLNTLTARILSNTTA